MIRKESRQFNISVEGINCEKMYFEHLAKLINDSDSTYNLKVDPRKMTPMQYAKRNAYRPVEKRKGNRNLPYIHIQDIEDYHSEFHRKKFYETIDEMREAEDEFGISYELGYSNYTFELWMLLHVADMKHAIKDRRAYLAPINRWFHRNFTNLDEFKREATFQEILEEVALVRDGQPSPLQVLHHVVQAIDEIVVEARVVDARVIVEVPGHDLARICIDTVQPFVAVLHDEEVVGKAVPTVLDGFLQEGHAPVVADAENLEADPSVAIGVEELEELIG